ncbi:hypothetical protein V9T40_010894 [Parthenolecanium corni]|uniref:C2H2-type domain-containing protein n=1 Tax=Parthenolecanium corni TaxID=536013 RepID=A0AAN9XYY6_9HEMI
MTPPGPLSNRVKPGFSSVNNEYYLHMLSPVFKVKKRKPRDEGVFPCPNCGRTYKYERNLKAHLKYECGVPRKFICKICDKAFALKGTYKSHMDFQSCFDQLDTINQSKIHTCPNKCGRSYKYQRSLAAHLKYECGVEKKFSCHVCGEANLKNGEFSTYMCPNNCGRTYFKTSSLYSHVKYECGVPKMFSCEICGKSFARKFTYKNHKISLHRDARRYRQTSVTAQILASDMKNLKQFYVKRSELWILVTSFTSIRGEAFLISENIYEEIPGYTYCPNNCGRKYQQKCSLYTHLKYECGVPRQFFCNVCGKSFARKFTYKKHMKMLHQVMST